MKDTSKFIKRIKLADKLMGQVRQTSDAVLDAQFLKASSELSTKKLASEAFGAGSLGVDISKFVSKCASFMRSGGGPGDGDDSPSASTQSRNRRARTEVPEQDDDDLDEGDPFAWDVLGHRAAFLCNRRAAAPSFLLGPLAVEKKVRNTQRAARSQRQNVEVALSRPEEIQANDLEVSESTNVSKICGTIYNRLNELLAKGEEGIEEEQDESMAEEEQKALFQKHHLSTNWEVPVWDFAINPASFAQTVENFFYLSFLIRDGRVQFGEDEESIPTLSKITMSAASSLTS
jgi:non-structural maintenance of chromosomes element 4